MHRILVEMDGIEGGAAAARTRGANALVWQRWRDPRLLRAGQNLPGAPGWRGFGFVECVHDCRDGEVKLMEINARMSGPIGPMTPGAKEPVPAVSRPCFWPKFPNIGGRQAAGVSGAHRLAAGLRRLARRT